MSARVPRSTTSSSRLARATTAAGQSAPYSGTSSGTSSAIRWTARCRTSVAPVAAYAANDSPGGIGVERADARVRTTVCPTPGTVSSRFSAAAAAANAGTPGTTS